MIALLLDLANILGGYLLAVPLLAAIPQIGDDVARTDRLLRPWAWVVGVVALVAGGYYLIVHLTDGSHVFHFEVIGIGVGLFLLWERLTGRSLLDQHSGADTAPGTETAPGAGTAPGAAVRTGTTVQGVALLVAIYGLIAIVVGIQGIFTPN